MLQRQGPRGRRQLKSPSVLFVVVVRRLVIAALRWCNQQHNMGVLKRRIMKRRISALCFQAGKTRKYKEEEAAERREKDALLPRIRFGFFVTRTHGKSRAFVSVFLLGVWPLLGRCGILINK